MNFSAMQNQVGVLLGDTSNTFYTETEIQNMINRVQPEIAAEAEALLTYYDYTTSDTVQQYSLPAEYLTVKHVELHVDTNRHEKLKLLDLDQFHAVSYADADRTGEPEYYKIEYGAVDTVLAGNPQRPGDIWLYPIPDDNGTANYTLRVYFYQMPTDLSADTDISNLPIYLHMAVCYRAAALLAMKNKDLRTHNTLISMSQRVIDVAKINQNRAQRDRPHYIKDVMGTTDYIDEDTW